MRVARAITRPARSDVAPCLNRDGGEPTVSESDATRSAYYNPALYSPEEAQRNPNGLHVVASVVSVSVFGFT